MRHDQRGGKADSDLDERQLNAADHAPCHRGDDDAGKQHQDELERFHG